MKALLQLSLLVAAFAIISCGDERDETVSGKEEYAILLTAENGKPIGPEIKYMKDFKAFGWFTAKDRVEWDIDVERSGEYDVFMEWSVDDKEAGKQFLLETKNDQLIGDIEKTGSWETFKTENVGKVKLEKGEQKVIFRSNADFDKGALLDLRQLKLVKR